MGLGLFGAARASRGAGIALGCGVFFGALLFLATAANAQVSGPVKCSQSGDVPAQQLPPAGGAGPDLIVGDDSRAYDPTKPVICRVKPGQNYYYGQVNIIANG